MEREGVVAAWVVQMQEVVTSCPVPMLAEELKRVLRVYASALVKAAA